MTKREMELAGRHASLSEHDVNVANDSAATDDVGLELDDVRSDVDNDAGRPGDLRPEPANPYTRFELARDPACLSKFEFDERDNYFKGCKWSPDGTCLMTCSNDKTIRLFNLPSNFGSLPIDFESPFKLNVDLQIKESGLVYDYCFNPNLNSSDPSSCL